MTWQVERAAGTQYTCVDVTQTPHTGDRQIKRVTGLHGGGAMWFPEIPTVC